MLRVNRMARIAIAVLVLYPGLCAAAADGSALRGLRPPASIQFGAGSTDDAGLPTSAVTEQGLMQLSLPDSARGGLSPKPGLGMQWLTPIGERSTSAIAGLPQYSLSGQVVHGFDSGLGLRRRAPGISVLSIATQHKWGALRGAYTLYRNGADNNASAPSHRLQLSFDYGSNNSIGLSYTTGREFQAGMIPYAVPGIETRDWALTGYHWLNPKWALTYDLINSDRATYHTQGLRFGIRHTF